MNDLYFKGWAKPGPQVPAGVEAATHETCDGLSGHFRIFQLKDGHRFSTDDLLAAWYAVVSAPSAQNILELGSGIGTAGMITAFKLQGARFVTIEAQAESIALARKSIQYNGLSGRFELREADFRDSCALGADEHFDLVIGTPPYFNLDAGLPGDHPQKIACRFETRGDIGDYCKVASRHLNSGGVFACVFPIDPPFQRARLFQSAQEAGLTIIRLRPIALKEGETPLLCVAAMTRSKDLPENLREETYIEPVLTIRRKDGSVDPEYRVIKLSIGFPP